MTTTAPPLEPKQEPPEQYLHYFTYGEYMLESVLVAAVGPITKLPCRRAFLRDYSLCFSSDDGKANIQPEEGEVVEGVIYRISTKQLMQLGAQEKQQQNICLDVSVSFALHTDSSNISNDHTLACITHYRPPSSPSTHVSHTSSSSLLQTLAQAGLEHHLSYRHFWQRLLLASQDCVYYFAYEKDMLKERLVACVREGRNNGGGGSGGEDEKEGDGFIWIGPVRAVGCKLVLGEDKEDDGERSVDVDVEGVLYLLKKEQLAALMVQHTHTHYHHLPTTVTATVQFIACPDVHIDEVTFLLPHTHTDTHTSPSIKIPKQDLGQIIYAGKKAGLCPFYLDQLQRHIYTHTHGEANEEEEEEEEEEGKTLVFVYGTLLKGLSNHHILEGKRREGGEDAEGEEEVTFLGPALTRDFFRMYDAGGFPFVSSLPTHREGGKDAHTHTPTKIKGEVYKVGREVLKRLDELEGYPGWYDRKRVCVCVSVPVGGGEGGEEGGDETGTERILHPFIYLNNDMQGVASIIDGDYRAYLSRKK